MAKTGFTEEDSTADTQVGNDGLPEYKVVGSPHVDSSPATGKERLRKWASLARDDLRAIYHVLAEHHPGPLDEQNPAFKMWHEAGFTVALDKAQQVDSYEGYYFIIRSYVAGFRDGHLNVSSHPHPQLEWPGFVVAWRRGKFVLHSLVDDAVEIAPQGAVVIACDGRPPQELLYENVFPYYGNPDLEASWTEWAPWLLVSAGNPWVKRPEACVLEVEGRRIEHRLQWRAIDVRELTTFLQHAQFGIPPDWGISEFAPHSVWISLPTFRAVSSPEIAAMRDLIRLIPSFRTKRVIVFDVRGNRGGNSQWGDDIIEALYGRQYFRIRAQQLNRGQGYAEWRVSKGNESYLRSHLQQLSQEFGDDSLIVERHKRVLQDMYAARLKGVAFCADRESRADAAVRGQPTPSPLYPQVFLLTDGRCGSACLDFADALLAMGNVLHIGMPTHADSTYGDVRSVILPSGMTTLTFAMKVHRNRARGHNVPYVPEARWDGEMSDTAALRRWVLDLIHR